MSKRIIGFVLFTFCVAFANSQVNTIIHKKWFDIITPKGYSYEPNNNIKELFKQWKSKSITLDMTYKSRNELLGFLKKLGFSDFTKIDEKKINHDVNIGTYILENEKYSVRCEYFSESNNYSIDSITIFNINDHIYKEIQIGKSFNEIEKKYGKYDFESINGDGEKWLVYSINQYQFLGFKVDSQMIIKCFQITYDEPK